MKSKCRRWLLWQKIYGMSIMAGCWEKNRLHICWKSFNPSLLLKNSKGMDINIITYDGDAHGYIGLQPQGNTLFLSKLYLQKQARGKGIARQALDMMREICREKGLSSIYLTVNKHNSSKQVYEALGFKTTREEVTDIGNGFVMDDYIMEILIGE